MALNTCLKWVLGGACALLIPLASAEPGNSQYDERVVEEVIVSAKSWRRDTPEKLDLAEPPRWQITDDTRQKLSSRMQVGYDPVLEEIRRTDNRIKVRGNMREPEPSTVFRVSF